MTRRAASLITRVVLALAVAAGTASSQEPLCGVRWELEETLRLGSVDGELALSPLYDLEVGPDGRIYLIQSWDLHVSVFEPDGQPAGRIGRAGSGPGEFTSPPRRLGWLADTLWVSERFATHFFLADGTPVRQVSFRVPSRAEGSVFAPGTPLADGTFLPWRSVTEQAERFLLADQAPLRRMSATGAVVDTVAMVVRHLADFAIHRETDRRGYGMMLSHPLAPSPHESWLPVVAARDGRSVVFIGRVPAVREDPSFDLLRIGLHGDTLLNKAMAYAPLPVTREEQALMRERFSAVRAGDHTPESLRLPISEAERERRRRIARDLITFPELHPPVRSMVAGDDGSIWLRREAWPRPADVWEVYGEDGELEGTLLIENENPSDRDAPGSRLQILRAGREEVWGQTRSALDVPYVHRFQVRHGCG